MRILRGIESRLEILLVLVIVQVFWIEVEYEEWI